MRKWEAVFPEADRALVKKIAMAEKQAFGKRPALIIVDVNKASIGSQDKPLWESVEEHPTSCGEAGWIALGNIKQLLLACRAKKMPIVFATNDPVTIGFGGGPTKRSGKSVKLSLEDNQIPDQIKPLDGEWVLWKTKASAFFGTALAAALINWKVDCLLVAGASTSGCIRATVVDAFSYRFPCFIPEECVFDRFELSHLVNLFDLNAKYADVITLEEALGRVANL